MIDLYRRKKIWGPTSLERLLEGTWSWKVHALLQEHRGWIRMEDTSRDHMIQLSCSEQGQLVQDVQGHVQSGFEYLKRIKTFDFLNFHALAKLNQIT